MLDIILLDMRRKNGVNATGILKDAFERRELPIRSLAAFGDIPRLAKFLEGRDAAFDMFITSSVKPDKETIGIANALKRNNTEMRVVFISDGVGACDGGAFDGGAPYPAPQIRLDARQIHKTILDTYIETALAGRPDGQPLFTFKSEGKYHSFRICDISYFESRGKKIAVIAMGREVLFYSNFDNILQQLPDRFVRCHKGYVVNAGDIAGVCFKEMTLKLRDKTVIPISRTYRNSIRALFAPRPAGSADAAGRPEDGGV